MSETQTDSAIPQEAQSPIGVYKGSFSTEDEPKAEVVSEQVPQEQAPEAPVEQAPVETVAEETTPETVEYWKSLAEKAGVEAGSEDDIVNYLQQFGQVSKDLPTLKEKAKYYESLDPLALDLDKAKKAGIDENLYLKARSLDTANLSDDDAIWMQFELQNAQLVKDDPKFARMKFEKELKAKYGLADAQLDELEAEENRDEIEFQKRSKIADAQSAKRYLQDWKQQNVTIPETQQFPKEEELEQIRNEYFQQADGFVDSIDTLDIPLDDSNVFKYGLEGVKDSIREDLRNPLETLKRHGIDLENQRIDAEKFGELLAVYYAFDGFSKPFSDYVLEKRNKEQVISKTRPEPPQPQVGGALPEKDFDERLAEAFERQRKARASAIT